MGRVLAFRHAPTSRAVRKARAVVKIPSEYLDLDRPITVTPGEVAEAFVKANPGLSRAAMAVSCDRKG